INDLRNTLISKPCITLEIDHIIMICRFPHVYIIIANGLFLLKRKDRYRESELTVLTKGWNNGSEALGELIKSIQFRVIRHDNCYYLQWITCNDLTNIEKTGEGGVL